RMVEDSVLTMPAPVQVPARAPDVTRAEHYALARGLGLQYGPAFQSVSSAWFCNDAVIGAIEFPACIGSAQGPARAELLHPAYLDGALQLLLDLARRGRP